jgi:hypothetical protein
MWPSIWSLCMICWAAICSKALSFISLTVLSSPLKGLGLISLLILTLLFILLTIFLSSSGRCSAFITLRHIQWPPCAFLRFVWIFWGFETSWQSFSIRLMRKFMGYKTYRHTFRYLYHQLSHFWKGQSPKCSNMACSSIYEQQLWHSLTLTGLNLCLSMTFAFCWNCKSWTPNIRRLMTSIWRKGRFQFEDGCYWSNCRTENSFSCLRGHEDRKMRTAVASCFKEWT